MAKVALKDWKEQIRDPKIECMSRDEMTALQSERLVKQVKNVYDHVEFYRKKMDDMGIGDHESKYTGKEDGDAGDEQFEINDNRSFDRMYKDMEDGGLQPVVNEYIYV